MWCTIKRHRKESIKRLGGNRETKSNYDLGKGEGRHTNIQVEVYFSKED